MAKSRRIRSYRRTIIVGLSYLSVVYFMLSCSSFRTAGPTSPDSILYIVNNSVTNQTAGQNFAPLPLPSVPPSSPRAVPLVKPKPLSPRQVVKPPATPAPRAVPPDGQINPAPLDQAPYSSGGKLTFNTPNGSPYYCTAELIGDQNVLLTAGHCVWDGGWNKNFVFNLEYNNTTSAGTYSWQCAAIVSGWTQGYYAYDFALIKLRGTPPAGQGMDINVGAAHIDEIGYPNNYYSGEVMVHQTNTKNGNDPSALPSTMGGGSSGGGWFIPSGGGLSAVSVNSFKFTNDNNTMYGPELSQTTLSVYDFVATGCLDSVPSSAASTDLPDDTDTLMSVSNEDISAGSVLSVASGGTCACGGNQAVLQNNSDTNRLVGVHRIVSSRAKETNSTDYVVLKPHESRPLGCFREKDAEAGDCSLDTQYFVESDRSTASAEPSMPTAVPGATLGSVMSIQDINQCIVSCNKAQPNNECFDLGQSAIGVLAPLGGFTQHVDGGGSAPNGTFIQKDAIITSYGGNPQTASDPCIRSDIAKNVTILANRGFSCRLETKTLVPIQGLRTRLDMPPEVQGHPTNWSHALSAASQVSATLFPDRTVGPRMSFAGTQSVIMNRYFGGDVHAISAISDKILVLSTSNGCLKGAYKK